VTVNFYGDAGVVASIMALSVAFEIKGVTNNV